LKKGGLTIFKKIENRIKTIVILAVSSVLIFSCIAAYFVSKKIFVDDFVQKSIKLTNQINENIHSHMNLIEETANLVSKSPRVIEALTSSQYDVGVIPVLDSVISTNVSIVGVSLYSKNDTIYTSSTVSSPPNLEYLKQNGFLQDFMFEDGASFWEIRNGGIDDYYTSVYYSSKSKGIITYVRKITTETGGVLGYLLIDTTSNYIYDYYDYNKEIFFKNLALYMRYDGDKVISMHGDIGDTRFINFSYSGNYYVDDKDKRIIINHKLDNSNIELYICVSLENILNIHRQLIIIMVGICFVSFVLLFIILSPLTKSVTVPLHKLQVKMDKYSALSYEKK